MQRAMAMGSKEEGEDDMRDMAPQMGDVYIIILEFNKNDHRLQSSSLLMT